jgi:hypothetical protein
MAARHRRSLLDADMHIGIGGHPPGDPNDPFVMVSSVLDQPFWAGPISKERREDHQLWAALEALGNCGVARHPLGVRIGEDPPDRYLVHGQRAWGTELTELTVQDVRRDLAPARRFGRDLQERLRARPSEFAHLKGRIVTLGKYDAAPMPRDYSKLLIVLEAALATDNGFVGEDVDHSRGLPSQLGTRGMYGNHGPFHVLVNPGAGNSDMIVSASSQIQVCRSEAIAALGARVGAKDAVGNEILLVTSGLVDENGYICQADQIIFHLLREASAAGISILPQKPKYIKGVLIHLWNSPFLFHWETGNDLPWIT